jgi:hypothetical protein
MSLTSRRTSIAPLSRTVLSITLTLTALLLTAGCAEKRAQPADPLALFTSNEGGFSVLLPGTPVVENKTVNTRIGRITATMYSVEYDGIAFFVAHSDYPESVMANMTAEQVLDGARDGAVANTFGTLTSETIISLLDYPGRELTITANGGGARVRIFLVRNRLYQVIGAAPSDKMYRPEIRRVLDSFTLI